MKNIEIREFKLTLEKLIEKSKLPSELKRMVLKEVYFELEQKANNEMILEIQKRDELENKIKETENAESTCQY